MYVCITGSERVHILTASHAERGGLGGAQLSSWWLAASYNPSTITYPKMSTALKNTLPTTQLISTGTSSELNPSKGTPVKPKFYCCVVPLDSQLAWDLGCCMCSKSSRFSWQWRSLPTVSLHKQAQPLRPVAVGGGVVRTGQVVLYYQYGLPVTRIIPLTLAAPVALVALATAIRTNRIPWYNIPVLQIQTSSFHLCTSYRFTAKPHKGHHKLIYKSLLYNLKFDLLKCSRHCDCVCSAHFR